MAKDVGGRIRQVMKELGINDPELGELTGTSKQAVGRWKHGITKPRAEALAMPVGGRAEIIKNFYFSSQLLLTIG